MSKNLEQAKEWYNGYNFGGTTIYNPWSIIKFIKNKHRYLDFVNYRHIEVIRRMKQNNIRPNRTIHLSYVPGRFIFLIYLKFFKFSINQCIKDEEIGGLTGFAPFIETKEFAELNVGVALDEGKFN